MDINIFVQLIIAIIMFASVVLIYMTIRSNKILNQNILFNEFVKQEIGLRIKLQEYRKDIHSREENGDSSKEIMLDYDTLLFGYYEYLAICLYKKLVNENDVGLYFKISLKEVKFFFDKSLLFIEGYAEEYEYPGLRWLFKRWDI